MTIGQKIKQLREQKGLTQEVVAKHLGVATQTIFKYEKRSLPTSPPPISRSLPHFSVFRRPHFWAGIIFPISFP
ncbi:MAG: helix-turn-helix transcriptional regulator [Clostridia bacterium]|nr:helix-turn-helix transcriptional regulator [Clostridia bacterium]